MGAQSEGLNGRVGSSGLLELCSTSYHPLHCSLLAEPKRGAASLEHCPLHSLQEPKDLESVIQVQRALLAQASLASLCCPSQSPCWWAVCSRESTWCQQPAQVVGTIAASSSEQMGSKLKPWWGDHPESWLLWCGFQTNGNMFQSGLAIGCNHGVEIC